MTTEEDGNTLDGTPPERFAPELERRGATIIGVNCAVGPAPMLETIERMEAVTRARAVGAAERRQAARRRGAQHLSLLAGVHGVVRRRFILHNVRVVGGCCGTTPEHIRQIKAAVRGAGAGDARRRRCATARGARRGVRRRSRRRRCRASRSRGSPRSWRAARSCVGVELLPPRGFEAEPAIERARELKRTASTSSTSPTACAPARG